MRSQLEIAADICRSLDLILSDAVDASRQAMQEADGAHNRFEYLRLWRVYKSLEDMRKEARRNETGLRGLLAERITNG